MLSIVFVACQLLLLGLVFGLVLLRTSEPAKPPRIPISTKTLLMGVAAGVVIMTAAVDIWSFQFQRQAGADNSTSQSSPALVEAGRSRVNSQVVRATAEAWQGRPMIIRFDEDACLKFEFGAITCETDYLARYDASANRWTVTGYSNADKKVVISTTPGDANPGGLSIWGALEPVDDKGIVRRFDQIVGTIRVAKNTEEEEWTLEFKLGANAMRGSPMIVRFDGDACVKFDFGSIACAMDYHAQFDGSKNRWTVTGYSKSDNKIITATADNADATPGALSIWGAIFRFDRDGTVFRFDQKVGTIRLRQDAQADRPSLAE